MAFRLPDSSLLPSTPNSRSLRSHPSTTPLVPPPSHLENPSTTPLVPPPKSVFGSSYPANAAFSRGPGSGLRTFALPESSPPQAYGEDIDFAEDEHEHDVALGQSSIAYNRPAGLMSSMLGSPRGLKRSRNGMIRTQKNSEIPAIARGIAQENRAPRLQESDSLILHTEQLVSKLDAGAQNLELQEPEEATTTTVEQLIALWQAEYPPETKEGAVGPASDDPTAEASYIASLLFQLHHPHAARAKESGSTRKRPLSATPVPQALLDWLNTYHNPFPDDFEIIHHYQPAPSANESFWDVIFSSLLRGKLDRVVRLLKDAGWEHAITALDDGAQQPGYVGKQLQNTRQIVEKCLNTLQMCPAVRNANWDVKGADWSLFRQRVRSALHELEAIAEGGRENGTQRENVFAQSARGSLNLSTASRKADSKVPWTLYENLRVLYLQLQGSVDEILLVSQDWLEASIFLTVWWDGDNGEQAQKGARKVTQHTREVYITPVAAYQQRLSDAFSLATSEPADPLFDINTGDTAQVGIACAMLDSVDSALDILRSLSLPIASAVADIAALNEWLVQGRPRSRGLLTQGFNNDDLMVLNHDSRTLQGDVDRDEILALYSDMLAKRQTLKSNHPSIERQGWEVAASVLGRMSDRRVADEKITVLFSRVEIKDDRDATSILNLCSDLGLAEQARRISERYADGLVSTTQRYGAMLHFFARAHATKKLKEVLTLLTSLCLAQSRSMPPSAAMDETLVDLLTSTRPGLTGLAAVDLQAAGELTSQLSGYATLRRYYDLRDQGLQPDIKAAYKPLERKRQAANALLAVIASASDCIRGGLFDVAVQSVISVDGLLVLLGEVLPLCGHQQRILTEKHIYTLLRVIEDFIASPARLRARAEELLKACTRPDAPALKRDQSNASSISGLNGSSYDLLVTSSMLLKHEDAQEPMKRAWDWRTGLTGLDAEIDANTLLLMLRVTLANELGKDTSD
ncbi:hypothetical protein AMS68_003052 [Peltaster fructicola]|uniref:Nuclear pore complex protein Nup85 n=1 Tax=Peltaster fructicola TaxID=286661 RepID=A0A6H0XSC2_9PEZI|nr:hypothetical protein AMS68_003052 [Peltaster fructicola]